MIHEDDVIIVTSVVLRTQLISAIFPPADYIPNSLVEHKYIEWKKQENIHKFNKQMLQV